MRILVGGLYSKKSGKTTFCKEIITSFHERGKKIGFYKPISGVHCWHDREYLEQTVCKGYFVSLDSIFVHETITNSYLTVLEKAMASNLVHVVFSRLNFQETFVQKILIEKKDVSMIEKELGSSIDSIPVIVRQGNRYLINSWWWSHPMAVEHGQDLREVILTKLEGKKTTLKNSKYLSSFLFWKPDEFSTLLDENARNEDVQVIELHDDDVLSGLPDLKFDYLVLVAGKATFLTTHDEWKAVIDKIKTYVFSFPGSKLFPLVKWIQKGTTNDVISYLNEQVS